MHSSGGRSWGWWGDGGDGGGDGGADGNSCAMVAMVATEGADGVVCFLLARQCDGDDDGGGMIINMFCALLLYCTCIFF